MSFEDASLDQRSLTLPNPLTAPKRRVRKPRKPSFWTVAFGVITAGGFWGLADSVVIHPDVAYGPLAVLLSALAIHGWKRARAGAPDDELCYLYVRLSVCWFGGFISAIVYHLIFG